MSVHALLKLLYELSKSDKMRGLLNILWLFRNEFNESLLLHPIQPTSKLHFLSENFQIVPLCTHNDVITLR